MFAAPSFMLGDSVFAATQKTPFNQLELDTRGACIPGSHGMVTIRESVVGRLPLPRHCTESRLKTPPFF